MFCGEEDGISVVYFTEMRQYLYRYVSGIKGTYFPVLNASKFSAIKENRVPTSLLTLTCIITYLSVNTGRYQLSIVGAYSTGNFDSYLRIFRRFHTEKLSNGI
jgi:hypothetical protein